MFRHPSYYKELRKLRNKSDQAISQLAEPVAGRRAPGQGLDPGSWKKFHGPLTEVLYQDKTVTWVLHVERNLMW